LLWMMTMATQGKGNWTTVRATLCITIDDWYMQALQEALRGVAVVRRGGVMNIYGMSLVAWGFSRTV
jgi:hypothetical protein